MKNAGKRCLRFENQWKWYWYLLKSLNMKSTRMVRSKSWIHMLKVLSNDINYEISLSKSICVKISKYIWAPLKGQKILLKDFSSPRFLVQHGLIFFSLFSPFYLLFKSFKMIEVLLNSFVRKSKSSQWNHRQLFVQTFATNLTHAYPVEQS